MISPIMPRPQTTLLVASAALVSPRVVRNSDFDARVIVRQCRRASYHQTCTGIAGSRGVRFSSPTEPDVEDWFGSKMWNGDGPKASTAVWDHDGFIGGRGLRKSETSPRLAAMEQSTAHKRLVIEGRRAFWLSQCSTKQIFSKNKSTNVDALPRRLPTRTTGNFGCKWRNVGKDCW